MHFIHHSSSLYTFHQRSRELIFWWIFHCKDLLKILLFAALARNLINRFRILLNISNQVTECRQFGRQYISTNPESLAAHFSVKPKVACYILFWKRQWSLYIMISYAELHRERTFPFYLTLNLLSGKKAVRWKKCYKWLHFFFLATITFKHPQIYTLTENKGK